MKFYTSQSMQKLLQDEKSKVVLLVGGFTGYLNFGDVIQLQGAIRIHRKMNPSGLILPMIHPSAFHYGLDRKVLDKFFSVTGWIYYSKTPEEEVLYQERMGQFPVSLDIKELPGKVLVHFYGSGRLNEYWGNDTLSLLEAILSANRGAKYLISGQQVSQSFLQPFLAHLGKWKPELIGCRDRISIESLEKGGIRAINSGDDALEVLSDFKRSLDSEERGQFTLGLNIRQTSFTSTGDGKENLPNSVIDQLRAIKDKYSPQEQLIAIRTFGYSQDQGIHIEELQELKSQLDVTVEMNLIQALGEGNFLRLSKILKSLKYAVVMSYHLAFYLRILGVPVYLLALNPYYTQKQASLAQIGSLQEYFNNPVSIVEKQFTWLAQQADLRKKWLQTLKTTIASFVDS